MTSQASAPLIPLVLWPRELLEASPEIAALAFAHSLHRYAKRLNPEKAKRFHLRARGTCAGCGYTLVGLPVEATNMVRCPECGAETEVDSSLGELVADEAGRMRFKPLPPRKSWWQRVMTPCRRRVLKRSAIACAVLIFGVLPASWGGYEVFLINQAAQAAKGRPGVEGMIALMESHQPKGLNPNAPNAAELLGEAGDLLEQIKQSVERRGFQSSSGKTVYGDLTLVYSISRPFGEPDDLEVQLLGIAGGLEILQKSEEAGLFSQLDEVAKSRRVVEPINQAGEELLTSMMMSGSSERNFARLCAARMHLAQIHGDEDEFINAFEASLATVRVAAHRPTLLGGLVAAAMEMTTYERLQNLLATNPSEACLIGLEAAMARQSERPPVTMVIDGERLAVLDAFGWFFSEPGRVRLGRYSEEVRIFSRRGILEMRPLGTYSENVSAIDEIFTEFHKAAEHDPSERPAVDETLYEKHNLALIKLSVPAISKSVQSFDQATMTRRGARVCLALARYRAAHGGYPPSLTSLEPTYLTAMPHDPWSGKPFGYRRIDPASDEFGRGYLLYTVGADMKDDGGVEAGYRFSALTSTGAVAATMVNGQKTGADFVINTPVPGPSLETINEARAVQGGPVPMVR